MMTRRFAAAALAAAVVVCAAGISRAADDDHEAAIFAGGCFWCVEADFDKVPGVVSTTSGYIGGSAETADYQTIAAGGTGHYEAVKIAYDPAKVSYQELLYTFWRTIDPTDDGGQFCDRGPSYRTGVFATSEKQYEQALASRKKAEKALGQEIVTPVKEAPPFYKAETYHQNYYKKNPVRYTFYRTGCGRDSRIRELWGDEAHAGLKDY